MTYVLKSIKLLSVERTRDGTNTTKFVYSVDVGYSRPLECDVLLTDEVLADGPVLGDTLLSKVSDRITLDLVGLNNGTWKP